MDNVRSNNNANAYDANRSWDKLLASVRGSMELFSASLDQESAARLKIVRHQIEEAIYQARCAITDAPRKK